MSDLSGTWYPFDRLHRVAESNMLIVDHSGRRTDMSKKSATSVKPGTLSDKTREQGWIVTGDGIVRRDPSAIVRSPKVQRIARKIKDQRAAS